jgi:phospholipid/cholesterol/gamma-HCH transport system substrate-binding protein
MISNLESITSNIREHNDDLAIAMKNFSSISDTLAKANLAGTMLNAERTLAQTADIMEKINKGEGSLGMLVNNDSLYNALASSAASLDSLLVDMKENPKRYVHFSMFGKKN